MPERQPRQRSTQAARLHQALSMIARGEAAAARGHLLELRAEDPSDLAALYVLGAASLRSGNPAAALEEFESLLDLVPVHDGAAYGRGLALFALGDRRAALRVFRHLTRRDQVAAKAWSSIADITPHEAERRHALNAAADGLAAIAARSGHGRDRRAAASALLAARRPAEAGALLMQARGPVSGVRPPDRLLARALYHQGRFRDAFDEACRLLSNLPAAPLRRPAGFDPGAASDALEELLALLSSAGAKAFLMAGTLLGVHRQGAPLAHDRDIDIGVTQGPGGGPDLASLLRAHDRILLARIARPGDRYFALTFKGIAADIFLSAPKDGYLTCGFSKLRGDIQWRFRKFEIVPANLGGRTWPVPARPEEYLAQAYGPGWQVPDKGFASVVSSPALYQTDIHARAYYAALRARTAYLTGDPEKAAALIRQSPVALPPLAAGGRSDAPD